MEYSFIRWLVCICPETRISQIMLDKCLRRLNLEYETQMLITTLRTTRLWSLRTRIKLHPTI